jgi:cytochrome c oxidase cbb3-type subunit 3
VLSHRIIDIKIEISGASMHLFLQQQVRRFATSVLWFIFFLAASAIANAQKNPMTAQNVQRGSAQFQQSCAICHGTEATGGNGPSLIESSLVRHDENGDLIGNVIREGRLDKGMPAFPLMNAANISDIVAFLHARIEVTNSVESEGPVGGYSLQSLLTGNAIAGKQYFYGAGKCATCHSPTGDLAGIAKKYSPADLESRFLGPSNDQITATVSLSSGQKVQGKLLHLDGFYVAVLDGDGKYRSWLLQQVKVQVHNPLAAHLELLQTYTDKDIHNVFSYLETLQ